MINILKSLSLIILLSIFLLSCEDERRSPSDLIDREFKTEYGFVFAEDEAAVPGDVVLVDLEYKGQPYFLAIEEELFDSDDRRGFDRIPFRIPVTDNFTFSFDSEEDITIRFFDNNETQIFQLNPGTTNSLTLQQGNYIIEFENNNNFIGGEGADTTFIPIFIQPDPVAAEQAGAQPTDDYRAQDKFIAIKTRSCVECDFGDTDSLVTINLDMSNSDLRGSYYKNTVFESVNFSGSNLSYIVLEDVNGRQLGETNMANAKFLTCNFDDADLSYTLDLSHVDFFNCSMERSNLEGSYGLFISFEGSVLRWSNLTRMFTRENVFTGGNYQSASFTYSVLNKSEFNFAAFRETVFDFADLSDSEFENSIFSKTSFLGTNMCDVDMINPNPREVPNFEPVLVDENTLCPESATIINE